MKFFELKNNILVAFNQIKNSPKATLSLALATPYEEELSGTANLIERLLEQETKMRIGKTVEFTYEDKRDVLSFNMVCSVEDLELSLEQFKNVINNPSFEELDKEKNNMRKEIVAEPNSAKAKVFDNYYKTIFAGHPYGQSRSTKMLFAGKKALAITADMDVETLKSILNKNLGEIQNENSPETNFVVPSLQENKIIEIIEKNAQKAQIVLGWIFPTFDSEDYASLCVLDFILGFDGLCSRLFLELRGKQDIVYAVRSHYEAYKLCASFSIYASTNAENIKRVLEGINIEIQKLKRFEVEDVELEYAKRKLFSKYQKTSENDVKNVSQLAYYETIGLGFDYQDKLIEKIKKVNISDIQQVANKYFKGKTVLSILKP